MAETGEAQRECVLVAEGRPRAVVVLDEKTRAPAAGAVNELLRGIAKATGARLFVDGTAVFANTLEPPRPAPVIIRFRPGDPARLGKDGFRVRVTADRLDFEAAQAAGFRNAVYTCLERWCGFRWLWPGPDGEVYQRQATLRVPAGQWQEQPAYRWRHLLYTDMPGDEETKWGIQEFHMRVSPACHLLFKEWLRRNRMGGLKVLLGHTWGRFASPDEFGRDHPEYFAEIGGSRQAGIDSFDGKHGGQLCTSNPAVIDLLTRRVRETFDRRPDLDAISISPNDGSGFCECDDCLAIDIRHGNPPPEQGEDRGGELAGEFRDDADRTGPGRRITGPITDRMFTFANAIAAGIARTHPDKYLLLLVYSLYREPPRQVRLADNIIAQFCVSCHQHWEPAIRDADRSAVDRLAAMTGETGIYEYFDQGAWPGLTRSFPDLVADSVTYFHRAGVRHYSTQAGTGFATNGFNLWFLARALWDTGASVDPLLDDYCRRGFGPAAAPMRRYLELWRDRWRKCRGIARLGGSLPGSAGGEGRNLAPFAQLLALYPPDFIVKATAAIEAARRETAAGSPERTRVDFFGRALAGGRLALEAARFSAALEQEGWPLRAPQVTPAAVAALGDPDTVRARASEALARWARWEACLEESRDDFLFSFFWARYCFDSRRNLHPHWALQQVLACLDGPADSKEPDTA